MHTLGLVFQQDGRLGPLSIELLISWSALIQLAGLTLVYFGYSPERSSFIFKLTVVSLVLLFGTIGGACWVQGTRYVAQYRPTSLPSAGSALEFTPQASGGYSVREAWAPTESSAGQPVEAEGGRIALHQQVEVTYDDEIGYLTESFNEMAHAQYDLVNTLEPQVAERSAPVAEYAARNARLEERNRLSADLHDTVTQTLFFASMLSEGLADEWRRDPEGTAHKLRQVAQMNRAGLAEMRMTRNELRSEDIVEQPLSHLIATLAQEFTAWQGTGVRIECEISGDTLMPLEVQAMMYRIAQESLNNIARHAGASHVTVALEALPGQAMISISDDGRGFDTSKVPQGHHGLQIKRERARRIDAVLEVESKPEAGTNITAIWMQQDGTRA